MGQVVKDISKGVEDAADVATGKKKPSLPNFSLPNMSTSSTLGIQLPNIGGDLASGLDKYIKNPGQAVADTWDTLTSGAQSGENTLNPAGDPNSRENRAKAEAPMIAQQKASADYQANLPKYQQQMQERLSQDINKRMSGQQKQVEQRNVSRGIGYGALNEGQKQSVAQQNQQQLAQNISEANKGLLDLGQQIQSGAISSGLINQNLLQQYQNQIYSQQQAKLNADNTTASGFLQNIALASALA